MAREFSKPLYNSKEWKLCRLGYLKSVHGICEECGSLAVSIHHKKWITPSNITDTNITLNWDNLQALCIECHGAKHGRVKPCVDGVGFDEDGNLIKTPRHGKY